MTHLGFIPRAAERNFKGLRPPLQPYFNPQTPRLPLTRTPALDTHPRRVKSAERRIDIDEGIYVRLN